jgi:hypothetical protein
MYEGIPTLIGYLQQGSALDSRYIEGINRHDCSHSSTGMYLRKLFDNNLYGFQHGEALVYEGAFRFQPSGSSTMFTGHIDAVMCSSLYNNMYALDYKPDLNMEIGTAPSRHFLQNSPQMTFYGLVQQHETLGEVDSGAIIFNRQGAIQFDPVEMYMDILDFMSGQYFSDSEIESMADEYLKKYESLDRDEVLYRIKKYKTIIPDGHLYEFLKEFKLVVVEIAGRQHGEFYAGILSGIIDSFLALIGRNIENEILRRFSSELDWVSKVILMRRWFSTYSIDQIQPFLDKLYEEGKIVKMTLARHTYYQINE